MSMGPNNRDMVAGLFPQGFYQRDHSSGVEAAPMRNLDEITLPFSQWVLRFNEDLATSYDVE